MKALDLKERADDALARLPGLTALAGLLDGAFWPMLFGASAWTSNLALSFCGALVAFLLLSRSRFLVFALCAALGFVSALWNMSVPSGDYSNAIGGRAFCGAELEARVVDEACCGEAVDWLPNPKILRMEAKRLRLPGEGEDAWREVSGLFAARLPDGVKPGYGALLRLEGSFQTPEGSATAGAFDYGKYLYRRNIHRTYMASKAVELSPGSGFLSALFDFRSAALKAFASGLKDDSSKRLMAALVFGCQQGVSEEDKADYIKSGVIHILSVSGMHVAMVAGILFLLLRPIPFRLRHLAIPSIVLLYAFTTGMQAPTFRAFAMLAVWSLLRAALLSTNALNSTLLAALLLLAWRPAQLFDPGFQYSFVCVVFLIGSAELFSEWRACARERLKWTPFERLPRRVVWKARLLETLAFSLGSCAVAWLASCGLSLLYQGLGTPFSIPANLALIPISWLIFICFAGQALLFWVPGFLELSGHIMEPLFEAMNGVCAYFAQGGGGRAPMPPAWSVALYLCLLLWLVSARRRTMVLASALAVALTLTAWNLTPAFESPSIGLLHGGAGQRASALLCEPRAGFALALDVPDYDAARQLAGRLAEEGIGRIDALLLSSGSKESCGGLPALLNLLEVERICVPKSVERSPSGMEALAKAAGKGARIDLLERVDGGCSVSGPLFSATLKKNGWTVECRLARMDIVVRLFERGDGLRSFVVERADGAVAFERELLNSSRRVFDAYKLVAE